MNKKNIFLIFTIRKKSVKKSYNLLKTELERKKNKCI